MPRKPPPEPQVVRTFDEARRLFEGEPELAVDLETGGFSPWKDPLHVITIYGAQSDSVAVLHYPRGTPVPQDHLDWLADFPSIVTHNGAQFDLLFLANAGMNWRKPENYDTLVGEQATSATGRRDIRVNLADTAKRKLGKVIDKNIAHVDKEGVSRWGRENLSEEQLAYCVGDIRYLIDLKRAQQEKASASEDMLRCLAFEMKLMPIVTQIGLNGLPVNLSLMDKYEKIQEERIAQAEVILRDKLGQILLTSNVQVKKALQERFGPRMFPDTKAETLMNQSRLGGDLQETCEAMLLFRQADQRRRMYKPEWRWKFVVEHPDGVYRVHAKLWQLGTDTGRFSGSEPNLQQIPRDVRDVFGHYPGLAVGRSDYAQIEVCVAAALANDRKMIEAINAGEDIHTFVASEAFGIPMSEVDYDRRVVAKAMNFLLLFGGGVEGLYDYATTNKSTLTRGQIEDAYDRYFDRFTGIKQMRDEAIFMADTRRAVPITYPTGLKRVVAGGELVHTTLLNNSVQGTAAAGLKFSLMKIAEKNLDQYVSVVVHDDVTYTAPVEDIEEIRTEIDKCMLEGMAEALKDITPVAVGVESMWGPSWKGDKANERLSRRFPE